MNYYATELKVHLAAYARDEAKQFLSTGRDLDEIPPKLVERANVKRKAKGMPELTYLQATPSRGYLVAEGSKWIVGRVQLQLNYRHEVERIYVEDYSGDTKWTRKEDKVVQLIAKLPTMPDNCIVRLIGQQTACTLTHYRKEAGTSIRGKETWLLNNGSYSNWDAIVKSPLIQAVLKNLKDNPHALPEDVRDGLYEYLKLIEAGEYADSLFADESACLVSIEGDEYICERNTIDARRRYSSDADAVRRIPLKDMPSELHKKLATLQMLHPCELLPELGMNLGEGMFYVR